MVALQIRALIQDLRRASLQVDIQDLRKYLTAPGGFHTHALERESG
jgi:hypothetical protein